MNTKSNGSKTSPHSYPEVHLYQLDLEKKNVESDQVILSGVSPDADTRIDIRGLYETSLTEPSQYSVFQMVYAKKKKTSDTSELFEVYKRELLFYDYKSSKLTMVESEPINDILKQKDEPNIRHTKDELLLTIMSDPKGARVIRYSLAANKIEKDLTIDTKDFNYEFIANTATKALLH
jgi:hypothetical protein